MSDVKKLKESWSREEVVELCLKALRNGYNTCFDKKGFGDNFMSTWVKTNL